MLSIEHLADVKARDAGVEEFKNSNHFFFGFSDSITCPCRTLDFT